MKKILWAVIVLLVVIIAGFVYLRFATPEDTWLCGDAGWYKHGNPSASAPTTGCPTIIDEPVLSANIKLDSPKAGDTVTTPLEIKGTARVFEATFNVRVKEFSSGKVLLEKTVMTTGGDMGLFNPFSEKLGFPIPSEDKIYLELFDYSAKDGAMQDYTRVALNFVPPTMSVNLYFNNTAKDPSLLDCAKVYPTARTIPYTQAVARAALEQLFLGANPKEKSVGFISNIPAGVKIQSLTIENGVAKVDLSKELETGVGGSCRTGAIRAQITETLKQFPTVKSVVISIDGRIEDILQP